MTLFYHASNILVMDKARYNISWIDHPRKLQIYIHNIFYMKFRDVTCGIKVSLQTLGLMDSLPYKVEQIY